MDIGTPILKLDLQSAETDYKQKLDEEQMRSYKLKQLKLENMTKLNDLQMKVKVAAMQLNRKKVELRNEQYLDSLGSGTTDKVRQAELSYNVAELEYEQLKQQYANEKEVLYAEYQVQELDFSIFKKTLAETKRTLDDAQIRYSHLYQQSDRCAGGRGLADCRHLRFEPFQGGGRDSRYVWRSCIGRRQSRCKDWQ